MSQAPISSTRHVYPPLVADLPRLSLSLFVRSRDGRRDGRRDTPRSHRRALRRPKRVRRERASPPTRPARLNPAQVFQRGAVTDHQRVLATLRRAPRGPVLGQDIRTRGGGRLRIFRERRHRHLRHRTGGVRLRTVRAHHRRSVEIGQDFARR